jgi:hypothetical protein
MWSVSRQPIAKCDRRWGQRRLGSLADLVSRGLTFDDGLNPSAATGPVTLRIDRLLHAAMAEYRGAGCW